MIGLIALIQRENYDFVVVGPEQPLAMGIVDALNEMGVKSFGPIQAAAQLEPLKLSLKPSAINIKYQRRIMASLRI